METFTIITVISAAITATSAMAMGVMLAVYKHMKKNDKK